MNILYSFRTRGVGVEAVHVSGISGAFEKLGNRIYFHSPCDIDPGANPFKKPKGVASMLNLLCCRMPRIIFELIEFSYNFFSWFGVRRRLRERDFGLIYERHAFFHFSTGFLAQSYKIPLVVEVNELVGDDRVRAQTFLSGLARWCDKRLFDRAALIVVVSPHLKRELMSRYELPCKKIDVQCNGVGLGRSSGQGGRIDDLALSECRVIGFVGWFVEWHRLDLLVEVFAELCNDSPFSKLKLLLVGDGPLRPLLVDQCRQLGVLDNVVFKGAVAHSCIPDVLRGVDIAVIPHSNQYRSPVKLFEYMLEECAVVSARTEPISMVIDDGKNGIMFQPLDKDDMRRAFLKLMSDSGLRISMGKQARKDVIRAYTWEHNVKKIMTRMEEIEGWGDGRCSVPG